VVTTALIMVMRRIDLPSSWMPGSTEVEAERIRPPPARG
jgi:hypothetical protein